MRWLGPVAAVAALRLAAPAPAVAVHQLGHPSATDPFAAVVAAVALTAWALAGWLLLVAVVTVAGRLPGRLGTVAAALSRRVAPLAVRRALEAVLGLTVAASALGATPAVAAGTVPPAPYAAQSLDWPTPAAPALDWPAPAPALAPPVAPSPAPPAAPVRAEASARPVDSAVVVTSGDTLWRIAAEHLPAPSTAAVARSWPRWWSANRAVIGSDPDLIHPGTRLMPPADPSTP